MPLPNAQRRPYRRRAWLDLSRELRAVRAAGRCECRGECGRDHQAEASDLLTAGHWPADLGDAGRCCQREGSEYVDPPLPLARSSRARRGAAVVLTVAHRDHAYAGEGRDDPSNLAVWCPRCHLRYDQAQHLATRAAARTAPAIDTRQIDVEGWLRSRS